MGIFSNAQGQLTPQSGVESVEFRTCARYYGCPSIHTCKNEEDLIKNEDGRVLTRLYVVFSDAQGQLTSKSAVEFCRNSNSSKLL